MDDMDTLRIEAGEIIVERFPARAGGELALHLMEETDWVPGTPTEINLREVNAEILISSFFSTFMKWLHKEDPKLNLAQAAATEIKWITKFPFQQENIQRWLKPFAGIQMTEDRKLTPSPEDGQRGDTIKMPVEYTDVNKLREMYPEKPYDLARLGYPDLNTSAIVEVISYPSPPSKDDMEEWARLSSTRNEIPFPQATILVRTTPCDPTTVREVPCFLLERVPHEDDNGPVTLQSVDILREQP